MKLLNPDCKYKIEASKTIKVNPESTGLMQFFFRIVNMWVRYDEPNKS